MFPSSHPISYLITEGRATDENYQQAKSEILKIVLPAMHAGTHLIQIREKALSAKNLFDLTKSVVHLAKKSAVKILVNDRADIARCAGADGVHLTSVSLPTIVVRNNFSKDFIIGKSTHSLTEAVKAKDEGADFITFSPIYATPSKTIFDAPQGLDKLKTLCEKLSGFPVIALGGINESNREEVLQAGAAGYASIRFHHQLLR